MSTVATNNELVNVGSRSLVPRENEDRSMQAMQVAVYRILEYIGENVDREGLQNTPKRVAKAFKDLTSGYTANLDKLINNAIFCEDAKDMVLVRDIDIFSMCEHHMLPIIGKAHVAYVPNGKVIGLSKIPRICEVFAKRLQVQERMTTQIAETLQKVLSPKGVMVAIEASHMCMVMRGVEKNGSLTHTSAATGIFRDDEEYQNKFYMRLRKS